LVKSSSEPTYQGITDPYKSAIVQSEVMIASIYYGKMEACIRFVLLNK